MDALQKVWADIREEGIDSVVSLGDNIGYGAESEAVLAHIRDHRIPSVIGNHELALNKPIQLHWFNHLARTSLEQVRESLSQQSLDDLKSMPAKFSIGDALCVHGFPPDSALTYLFEVADSGLMTAFKNMQAQICFVGHTHLLQLVAFDGYEVHSTALEEGVHELNPHWRYIVNVGSVGQPRDGSLDAKYAIWDSDHSQLEIKYIPYDGKVAAQKILDAGLPKAHAQRLYQ